MVLGKKKNRRIGQENALALIADNTAEAENGYEESADALAEKGEGGELMREGELVRAEDGAPVKQGAGRKDKRRRERNEEFAAFYELAELLNTDIESVKDECCLFEIRKLMSSLGRVIVRFNLTDAELERAAINCDKLQVSELLVSPAYLPSLVRAADGELLNKLTVNAIVDFPFGESTYKSKLTDVKDVLKQGVDGFTVMMPAMMLEKDNLKLLRRQCKRFARMARGRAGAAVSAMELGEDAIRTLIKTAERAGLEHVTFVFGEAGINELKEKFALIGRHSGKKVRIKILGNVSEPEAVMELFKMGARTILTPFAEDIGAKLLERFKIKSLKL